MSDLSVCVDTVFVGFNRTTRKTHVQMHRVGETVAHVDFFLDEKEQNDLYDALTGIRKQRSRETGRAAFQGLKEIVSPDD